MKKYIILLGIALQLGVSLLISAQDPAIMPDSVFHSNNSSIKWFRNGTAFCYFNGATYAMVWKQEKNNSTGMSNWYAYVYIWKDNDLQPFTTINSPKLKFGYKYEDDNGYGAPYRSEVLIIGNTYGFSYYGYLWFSCVVKQPPHPFDNPDVYYQLWARYDPVLNQWKTWYDKISNTPVNYNVGACQVDSLLNMIYYDGASSSLRKAFYDFDPAASDISYIGPADISLPGKKFGGMFAYKDTAGYTSYVYNTFDEGSGLFVTYDGPKIGRHIYSHSGVGSSVMMQGSVQGMRQHETLSSFEGNRFNIFFLGNNIQSDNSYPLYNWEWIIPQSYQANLIAGRDAMVTLPAAYPPRKVDGHWQVGLTMALVPMDFSSQLDSTDGLAKKLMVFYADNNLQLNGAFFNSDNWRPVPNSILKSTDLANDSLYGPEIRKLWTLVGITDGAPPCSINWHNWDSTLNLNQHEEAPSEFSFSTETAQTSEVTSTYEDAYSLGSKISISSEKIMGMELGFEYTQNFKSMVSSSSTVRTKLTTNFALNEESQDYGYYLWSVPQITRITYMVYPWYDNTSQVPIAATRQYRFITQGATIMLENRECSEFPFLINEPNNPDLYDFTSNARQDMFNGALNNGLSPIGSVSWTSPNPGGHFDFAQINKTITSMDTTNSFSWDESSSFGCPGVFKVSMNLSQDVSYSSGYTYETEFGNEVEISLENLVRKNYGVNFSHYNVDVYWFKPEKADWWYLEEMNGQKPWYIGYIVTSLNPKLTLLSPDEDGQWRASDLLFCWQAENGELFNYELFISTDPTAGPGSTIYRLSCGNKTAAIAEGFTPEQGTTYYWSVRGFAANGEPVWSRSRALKAGEDQPGIPAALLQVSLYPNPAGKYQVTISYNLSEQSKVSVCVYDINGKLLQEFDEKDSPAGVTTDRIGLEGYAPGIYVVQIRSEKANVVKKLIIR
jgi:hypothetical protein